MASHTVTADSAGIQISYPRSPVYPVREISTATPLMCPLVTRKYRSASISASLRRAARQADVGPLQRERGDAFRDILDLDTHARRDSGAATAASGSAAVHRYASSANPRNRPIVNDLALLIAPRRVVDLPDLHATGIRVMTRLTSARPRPGPLT
jgi:hypothetical protein